MALVKFDTDLCVIGGGAAALVIATAGAVLGVPVTIVEQRPLVEPNGGAIARAALGAAARRAEAVRRAAAFGIAAAEPRVDFEAVRERVGAVVAKIALDVSAARLGALGAEVIAGEAHFVDANSLGVGERTIRARRFVIATEAKPIVPSIPGLAEVRYLSCETVLGLKAPPEHLLVLGAGRAGLEFAQAFRRLGSAVTVIEAARPLGAEDPEAAAFVLDALAREGVEIRAVTEVHRIEKTPAGVRAVLAQGEQEPAIEGSHVLVAVGREADIDGLGLEAAGIARDPAGIRVDRNLRTTNKRVYAVGAAAGADDGESVAAWQAGRVVRHALFRIPARTQAVAVPRVVFTDPELAQIGLREEEARREHRSLRILRWPYSETDRARIERMSPGLVKIVTTRAGRILGVTIAGAGASELIALFALPVSKRMPVDALAAVVLPHPSLAEGARRAAQSDFSRSLTSPWLRRMVRLLRKLG